MARVCADHGHRAAAALSAVAGAGWLLHTALIAHNAVSYELALLPDRAAAAALADRIYAGPVFLAILLPMLALSVVGTIGAAVALWRAGHARSWAAACLALAILSDFVAPERVSATLARRLTRNPRYTDPVANLTIAVDDEVLLRARVRAAAQGTSVNAVLRDELRRYAASGTRHAADAFLALARDRSGASEPGLRWTREELHLDRLAR